VFAGIGSTKTDESGARRLRSDPHTVGDREDVLKPSNALGATDAAAGQWTKIAAGILNGGRPSGERGLWVVSFATVQNDKYLEGMEYVIPFPSTLDKEKVRESVQRIERWQKEGWKLAAKAKPRETSRKRKHLEIRPMLDAVRPQVEATVSGSMAELIAANGDAWEQAAREYSPMMVAVAKSLSPGYTAAALERRRQIAAARPDMRPDAAPAARTPRKKGGAK
jgi:hypothetical protein